MSTLHASFLFRAAGTCYPVCVTGISSCVTRSTVHLQWEPGISREEGHASRLQGYTVKYSIGFAESITAHTADTEYILSRLKPNTTVTFEVSATSACAIEGAAKSFVVTTSEYTVSYVYDSCSYMYNYCSVQ